MPLCVNRTFFTAWFLTSATAGGVNPSAAPAAGGGRVHQDLVQKSARDTWRIRAGDKGEDAKCVHKSTVCENQQNIFKNHDSQLEKLCFFFYRKSKEW